MCGPLYSLPPFLGFLEQVGKLLFGLGDYHPTVTLWGGGAEVRGPWSLGRRKVPNARCWYTQGDCLYSEAEQQSAPSLAAATLHVEEAATSPLPFFLPVLFPSLCNEVPSSLLFSQSSYGPGKANPPLWQEAEVVLQERTGEVPPLPSRQSFSGKLCIWCGE